MEGDCLEIRDFLPSNYLERMKEIFKPGGLFWKETGYPPPSFYSFYIRKPLKSRNVLEQVIFDIMLKRLSETYDTSNIVGGEFWAHTRSGGSSLGHQLHYDTDELRLEKEKILKHPAISSVLYLSSEGGNTLVFDDEKTYVVKPEAGKFMAFKGDRLHGVLPCKGSGRRTTFMVGFWEEEKVNGGGGKVGGGVGPWSELPRAGRRANWIREIEELEEEGGEGGGGVAMEPTVVEGGFEEVEGCEGDLEIPDSVNQRFFFDGGMDYFKRNF